MEKSPSLSTKDKESKGWEKGKLEGNNNLIKLFVQATNNAKTQSEI